MNIIKVGVIVPGKLYERGAEQSGSLASNPSTAPQSIEGLQGER